MPSFKSALIFFREQSGRQHIKGLNKSLSEIHKDREKEVQNRNEMIAYLKDQVQEMKAKTIMESKYVNKCAEVGVAQTLKQRTLLEESHRKEIDVSMGDLSFFISLPMIKVFL